MEPEILSYYVLGSMEEKIDAAFPNITATPRKQPQKNPTASGLSSRVS